MMKGLKIILYVVSGMATMYLILVYSTTIQQAQDDRAQSRQEVLDLKAKVNASRKDADRQWIHNQEQQETIQLQQQSLEFQGELLKEVEGISRGLLLESVQE